MEARLMLACVLALVPSCKPESPGAKGNSGGVIQMAPYLDRATMERLWSEISTNSHSANTAVFDRQAIDARGESGETFLHIAARLGDNDVIIAWLLKNGADPDVLSWTQQTPLTLAAYYGRWKCVQALIKGRAKVDKRCSDRVTPLMSACMIPKVRFPPSKEPLPKAFPRSISPLYYEYEGAAEDDYVRTVRILLDAGANPNLKDRAGRSVTVYAKIGGSPIIERLVQDKITGLQESQAK